VFLEVGFRYPAADRETLREFATRKAFSIIGSYRPESVGDGVIPYPPK
jgi:hypothetical protein